MRTLITAITTCALTAANGQSLDLSWGTAGIAHIELANDLSELRDVLITPDGKVLACGPFVSNYGFQAMVSRFLPEGTADPTWGSQGVAIGPMGVTCTSIAIQSDGKVLACGRAETGGGVIGVLMRFLSNGELDPDFANGGLVNIDGMTYLLLADVQCGVNGRIYVVGTNADETTSRQFVACFDQAGVLDPTFSGDGIFEYGTLEEPRGATCCAITEDGGIFIGGSLGSADDESSALSVLKLGPSGELDLPFGAGDGIYIRGTSLSARAITLADNGEILVAGIDRQVPGVSDDDGVLVRLDPDGAPIVTFGTDGMSTFDLATEMSNGVSSLVSLSNGNILVGGSLTSDTSPGYTFVLGLNAAGETITTFGQNGWISGEGSNSGSGEIAVDQVGRLYQSGYREADAEGIIARFTVGNVGIATDEATDRTLRLYPVPADNGLTLEFPSGGLGPITIHDARGRSMMATYSKMPSNDRILLDTSNLTPGFYEIRLSAGNSVRHASFVVQH